MVRKWFFLFLAAVLLVLGLAACGGPKDTPATSPAPAAQTVSPSEVDHLVKLCKVWGYTKYRHPAFLKGEKDWDAELQALIPQVRAAQSSQQVNELLHTWLVSLGEVKPSSKPSAAAGQVQLVDLSWTQDEEQLGPELAADLRRLSEAVPHRLDQRTAPVWFDWQRAVPDFSNEKEPAGDCQDAGFRLVGLFRLWNAMEYYFPYQHLLAEDWEESLRQSIPAMLSAQDEAGYRQTLIVLANKLQDGHVCFFERDTGRQVWGQELPMYPLQVSVQEAEGQLVVTEDQPKGPLKRGDVLLSIDGESIQQLAEQRRDLMPVGRKELFLQKAASLLLRSRSNRAKVAVLRAGQQREFTLQWSDKANPSAESQRAPFQLLEGNIGLWNADAFQTQEQLYQALEEARSTDGLIVDLRRYPGAAFAHSYPALVQSPRVVTQCALSLPETPGSYQIYPVENGYDPAVLKAKGLQPEQFYPYQKPVVVLIHEGTVSYGEYAATVIRAGDNAVLLGRETTGADGNVGRLLLPGGLEMSFSSMGVYEADGDQTQCTGISPDIRVEPTVQGIAQGRDEQLEAALAYLARTAQCPPFVCRYRP